MRYFVAFILLSISKISSSQTYSKVISDDEIIKFINLDIKRDSVDGIKTVRREMFKLFKDVFYYKDSADYEYKNNNNSQFIFRRHFFKGREISFRLDTIFNRKDIDYFLKQINGLKQRKSWEKEFDNSKFFDDVKLASNTRVDLNYNNRVKLGYDYRVESVIYTYSIPLFSADKKKAIIIKGFFCGLVCGGGAYYIYKKMDNNEWMLLTKANEWAE